MCKRPKFETREIKELTLYTWNAFVFAVLFIIPFPNWFTIGVLGGLFVLFFTMLIIAIISQGVKYVAGILGYIWCDLTTKHNSNSRSNDVRDSYLRYME